MRAAAKAAKPKVGVAPKRPTKAKKTRKSFDREEWLAAARVMLISRGVAAVKVDRLAKALGVSRGGFYWRVKSRAHLLNALLDDWRKTNSVSMLAAAIDTPGELPERCLALAKVWIEETGFDAAYDMAIRDWARTSLKVARAVQEIDSERIDAIRRMFLDGGYNNTEAEIRARVTYYHQVGYYAMRVKEPRSRRLELADWYVRVLTGLPPNAATVRGGVPGRRPKRLAQTSTKGRKQR